MSLNRLLDLYRSMRRIRAFEDAAEVASQGGVAAWGLAASSKPALVRGPLHLSTGQEAVAAGVCFNLQREDLLTSTHRGHGHTLDFAVATKAEATSETKVKSRVCEPSPTTVNGTPASFWRRKTPKTAP